MTSTQYRAEPAQPQPQEQTLPFDSAQAQRRREIGVVIQQSAHEYYRRFGGAEIDNAIALLNAFAIDGAAYVKKVMSDQVSEIDARAQERQQPQTPDAEKLPEGSEARKLVSKAARAKPIIDAAAATRLSKLLMELVNLRRTVYKTAIESVTDLMMYASDGQGFDTALSVNELARRLKAALEMV